MIRADRVQESRGRVLGRGDAAGYAELVLHPAGQAIASAIRSSRLIAVSLSLTLCLMGGVTAQPTGIDEGLPTILRSESELPEPVREKRQKLIEAARSGDIENLRALMQAEETPPDVALSDPGDPIEYLKALSADAGAREILAILVEVLESGFVHAGEGTDGELYVWPYFARYPLQALTPEQIVELFTLVTAADYEDMKSYGTYTYFRVGIAPDGRWLFFLAGA